MEINYWDCEYNDYDEVYTGEDEIRMYRCTHPANKCGECELDNKYGGEEADCKYLEEKDG